MQSGTATNVDGGFTRQVGRKQLPKALNGSGQASAGDRFRIVLPVLAEFEMASRGP
jgi:hypothetical protein